MHKLTVFVYLTLCLSILLCVLFELSRVFKLRSFVRVCVCGRKQFPSDLIVYA